MKPYLAAVVVYNGPHNDQSPAIVGKVNEDGTVDLTEFHANGFQALRKKVTEGTGLKTWQWPVNPNDPPALVPAEAPVTPVAESN